MNVACFSLGSGSPVSTASLTNRSCADKSGADEAVHGRDQQRSADHVAKCDRDEIVHEEPVSGERPRRRREAGRTDEAGSSVATKRPTGKYMSAMEHSKPALTNAAIGGAMARSGRNQAASGR
jgi:hypothetical protein